MRKIILVMAILIVLLIGCETIDKVLGKEKKQEFAEEEPEEPLEEVKEEPELVLPEPVLSNENNTRIEEVKVEPACVSGEHAAEVYWKIRTVPNMIIFQVRETGQDYKTIYKQHGVYEKRIYFSVCDSCQEGEFSLLPDKRYLFRVGFNFTQPYKIVEYSNEHLIDTSNSSEIMKKECRKEKIILTGW
ncbi:hypothetical protein GF323_06120 [Candidatus Woesearchaeota archaeon]|nr:hypothetical protein [Candidatus Woesearchaeota archaeon]